MDNNNYNEDFNNFEKVNNVEEEKSRGLNEYDKRDSNLNGSSLYNENLKKPKEKRNGILAQLILVALMSSILGGAVTGAFFQFAVPSMQPSVKSYFGIDTSDNGISGGLGGSTIDAASYKKVVIENATSPVVAVAEKVGPSVVGISVKSTSTDDFFFFAPRDVSSSGSGIIIKSDGYIMTNNHVIESALLGTSNELKKGSKIEVILPNNTEKTYIAQVVGRDDKTDLAVLKIEIENLPAVEFANSDDVKVGELAIAIGNPGGMEYMGSVTVGVISGLNRKIPIDDGKELKLIQTDAAINPGNSGGALVNSEGMLIGVNTAKIGGEGYEGLGFAIPVNKAKEITDSLIEYKYVKGRPFLGITAEIRFNEEMAKQYDMPIGVLISEVHPFSGAYKAGLRANDIITSFDGISVETLDKLNELKNIHKPGDIVKIGVYRDGETINLEIELGEEK